jgi:hypothetical protein
MLPIVAQYLTDAVPMAEALQMSAAVVVSYIFGQGYVDAKVIEASK